MQHATRQGRRAGGQAGFTLLEVLLAFAILAMVTSMMSQAVHGNMEKAADAIDKRELREIADTVFGKILFEQTEHRDGDDGDIAQTYGGWANLAQERADRYKNYRWRLEKVEQVAAGQSEDSDDADSLFGDPGDEDESETSSDPAADGQPKAAIKLIRFTLVIYHTDRPDEPLVTLTRFLPPPDFQGAGTR